MYPMNSDVVILAIIFGGTAVIAGFLFSFLKTVVKQKKNNSLIEDGDFIEALRHFKEKTDQRLTGIEKTLGNLEKRGLIQQNQGSGSPEESVQIEGNLNSEENEQATSTGKNESGLKNMLKT